MVFISETTNQTNLNPIKKQFSTLLLEEQKTFCGKKGLAMKARHHGSYVGEKNDPSCKMNKYILPTQYQGRDFFYKDVGDKYKRNYKDHKKGDVKLRKMFYWEDYYPSLMHFWSAANEYPTVSYGLTADRREMIVIDSDDYYDSLSSAKDMLRKFMTMFRLPAPSYILRNPSSGHIQIGWQVEPYKVSSNIEYENSEERKSRETFNSQIKLFAAAWHIATGNEGDICFNGPACKNPFYKGFESEVYSYGSYEKKDIQLTETMIAVAKVRNNNNSEDLSIKYTSSPSSSLNINSYNDNADIRCAVAKEKKQLRKSMKRQFVAGTNDEYECRKLREWVWSRMRNNLSEPTVEEAVKQIKIFALEASVINSRPMNEDRELEAKAECTLTWAVKHYRPISVKSIREGQALGQFVKKVSKLINYSKVRHYKKDGMTQMKIAKTLGVTQAYVSKLSKMSKEEAETLKNEVYTFRELYIKACVRANSLEKKYEDLLNDYDYWIDLDKEADLSIKYTPSSSSSSSSLNINSYNDIHKPKEIGLDYEAISQYLDFMEHKQRRINQLNT